MLKLSLNGKWSMRRLGEDKWLEGTVPGSVYNDLLALGLMEDPFYRDNEDKALKLADYDYEYEREFNIDKNILDSDRVYLRCEGIDTLADIKINGRLVSSTNNMHRTYKFDVKEYVKEGTNLISIKLSSPTKFMEEKQKEHKLWETNDMITGFAHIRKAHCMSGWDWGPKLPDLGIWRNISIEGRNYGELEDVYIIQEHDKDKAILKVRVKAEAYANEALEVEAVVISPEGEELSKEKINISYEANIKLEVVNPKLWWPNGYGEQPLHKVQVTLRKAGDVIDSSELTIGLRTLTVRKEKDEWGESFEFNVNGTSIFSMGADYILEDNILSRYSYERTEHLIKDCVEANFNCIRVWGGAIYPEDYFYDLCDKYGLIVWQDLMFACAIYNPTEEFIDNITHELEDNMKRIRHHACLGLWCGNNEIEVGIMFWGLPTTDEQKKDYLKQFEEIMPAVAKRVDPNTFYWVSSPSSGGGFNDPNGENQGDVHYWDVWHGLKPFTDYRKYHFRFASEYGFQSFPCLKTVESFTLPEDRNIFSYVMEKHQKNGGANGKIMYYLSQNFKYPKDFDSLLYTSQILQAEAIKYGVEHWRRNRGRCMGSIYWQLNDCWPVASWASIDYFGRWKALHYFAKRFYSPVLASACEEGTSVEFHVSNESINSFSGVLAWKLRNQDSSILESGEKAVEVNSLSTDKAEALDFSSIIKTDEAMRKVYLEYKLSDKTGLVSSGTVILSKAKHYEFLNPGIKVEVRESENEYLLSLKAEHFAKYVELSLKDADCRFSDNYFDLCGGEERTVSIFKSSLSTALSVEDIKAQINVRSIYDIAK